MPPFLPDPHRAAVYIGLIAHGRFREAFEAIVPDNPLPSFCPGLPFRAKPVPGRAVGTGIASVV